MQSPRSVRRHLDLGCATKPRNPFQADVLYGFDSRDLEAQVGPESNYVKGDLLDALPFETNFFASVSAYDVLEHIPRVIVPRENSESPFPFVSLMNEIWRILEDGGIFIASTPAFPSKQAFQDPTHVNFITIDTHRYFTGGFPGAADYGFVGRFEEIFVGWDAENNAWNPSQAAWRKKYRNLEHVLLKRGGRSHITWKLAAVK